MRRLKAAVHPKSTFIKRKAQTLADSELTTEKQSNTQIEITQAPSAVSLAYFQYVKPHSPSTLYR